MKEFIRTLGKYTQVNIHFKWEKKALVILAVGAQIVVNTYNTDKKQR